MEVNSPYLEAIQTIAGTTPGEKYRELNRLAKKIASGTKAHGDATSQISIIPDISEPLQPLVRVEMFNQLRQYEGIVEALKSDDCEIVDRALRIDWFFRGDNKSIINVDYFEANLFRKICLNTRIKLVKKLSTSLRASGEIELAEKFYSHLAKKYGKIQAEPLFMACGETFIWNTVIESRIALSCRLVKNLFVRYPEMIVRYMKLTNDKVGHQWINIRQYNDFLPRLIKNHLKALIELIETQNQCFGIKLSNKATERFLKGNVDAVLEKPALYTAMMPLKVIAAKITKAQYKTMFAKIYPPKVKDFCWNVVKNYIQYYPEQERISLIIDTYEDVYGGNLLDNHDAINEDILRMLPGEELARQARIKLEKEPDWHKNRWSIERTWRCYLPIDESIPSIKTEISKTSSADDRATLFQQMFYTCKVNDDKDALLEVLRYFTTRHKNEQPDIIFRALNSFVDYIDLFSLGKDHWIVMNNFIRFLHVKDELVQRSKISKKILTASIHFSLTHDLPIDENIALLIEVNMRAWNQSWSILEKYPEYERLCLDKMFVTVPLLFPREDKIWKTCRLDVLQNIILSLYDFNARNAKANNKIEKLSIINYPWLLEDVKTLLDSKPTDMRWKVSSILSCLKEHEPEIYEKWFPMDPNAMGDVQTGEALKILKNNPLKILARWEDYLKNSKNYVTYDAQVQRFVKSCRWYQEIPIKFFTQCLKDVRNETDENALFILGILVEGSSFARLIEPLVPKESSIDTTRENAKSTYKVIYAIPRAMNLVNPPVPLSLVVAFCQGEYLNLGLMTLTNICRRVSVEKIETFAKTLTDRRVSVKKHGIRMFCLVASIDDFQKFLADLWMTEKHRSIRSVIFQKIYDTFMYDPSPESWAIMKRCMNGLTIDDEDGFEQLTKFDLVSDKYIADFIQVLFETLERHVADGSDSTRMATYIGRVLLSIGATEINLLPEEYSEQLIIKYFCNPNLTVDVHDAGMRYALNGYLRSNEETFEKRLINFGKHYENVLRKHWDVPDSKISTYFPVNWMTHKFINEIIFYSKYDAMGLRIMETLLKSFLTVLQPEQDWISYVLLTYGIAFKCATNGTVVTDKIVETLPHLVNTFSSQLVGEFSTIATRWIDRLYSFDDRDTVKYALLGKLCGVGTLDACTMAAKLLFRSSDRQFDEERSKIVKFLKETGYPSVVSLVYQHVNSCTSTF